MQCVHIVNAILNGLTALPAPPNQAHLHTSPIHTCRRRRRPSVCVDGRVHISCYVMRLSEPSPMHTHVNTHTHTPTAHKRIIICAREAHASVSRATDANDRRQPAERSIYGRPMYDFAAGAGRSTAISAHTNAMWWSCHVYVRACVCVKFTFDQKC